MVAVPRSTRPSSSSRAPGAPRTVLLTGFDPFGGDAVNPSWLIASALHRRQVGGHRIVAAQLPTQFGASVTALRALLKVHRPALVKLVRVLLSWRRKFVNLPSVLQMPQRKSSR